MPWPDFKACVAPLTTSLQFPRREPEFGAWLFLRKNSLTEDGQDEQTEAVVHFRANSEPRRVRSKGSAQLIIGKPEEHHGQEALPGPEHHRGGSECPREGATRAIRRREADSRGQQVPTSAGDPGAYHDRSGKVKARIGGRPDA